MTYINVLNLRMKQEKKIQILYVGANYVQRKERKNNTNDESILKNAYENGIITDAYVEELMNKQKKQKILKQHKFAIYQEKSGKWATYVPTVTGRLIKRRTTRI